MQAVAWPELRVRFHEETRVLRDEETLRRRMRAGAAVATTAHMTFLFGGRASPRVPSNALAIVRADEGDSADAAWQPIVTVLLPADDQQWPLARHRASLCAWQSDSKETFLFLFGGKGANGRVFDDFWRFSLRTQTWQELPRGPPARFSCALSARSSDGVVFCHGGLRSDTCCFRADAVDASVLWQFSPAHVTSARTGRWSSVPLSANAALDRYSHVLVSLSSERTLVIGGVVRADVPVAHAVIRADGQCQDVTANENSHFLYINSHVRVRSQHERSVELGVFGGGCKVFAFGACWLPSDSEVNVTCHTSGSSSCQS